MKKITIIIITIVTGLVMLTAAYVNESHAPASNRTATEQSKTYWYDGKAEISSYKLTQARYGELRAGNAVLIYVTEPFSKAANTKADYDNKSNVPVLKLNSTKNFVTGIYPYSLMTSTFFPFENSETSLKIATSMQEWCGMAYLEMKNEGQLVFNLNSYFEGRSVKDKALGNVILEDDLWTLMRLNPELLPVGEHKVMPSLFYTLLKHTPIEAATANLKLTKTGKDKQIYEITYPALKRTLAITFAADFPYSILSWEETYPDGYGTSKMLTTKGELIKTIKTAYWNQSSTKDEGLRQELGL